MTFAAEDFHDLIRLLEQHPEWRAELRRLVLSDEVLALPAIVARLAQAQEQTQESLRSLAARVDDLAVRLEQLTARMDQLVVIQTRAEERLERLEAGIARLATEQRRTNQELGALSELVGARAETDAEIVLLKVLEQHGYQILADPGPIAVDGEVDVAVPVRDPDGRQLWAVVQAEARLHRADVRAWVRSLRSAQFRSRLAEGGVTGPLLPYAFGLRVYRDAEEEGLLSGVGILGPRGERVPPRAPIA